MISLSRASGIAATLIVAFAVTPSALPQSQSSRARDLTSSIAGRVRIGDLPARGIAVLLVLPQGGQMPRPVARATTDPDGRFQMTGVRAGQYILQAFAPALIASSDNRMDRSGKVINLSAGETVDDIDIELNRGAAITGRVIDANGQPVIQESVRLFSADEKGRRTQIYLPYAFMMSMTDDRGVYRLFGVPPGRYILAAGLDTSEPNVRMNSGNTYYPLTYHPDETDEARAAVIEVAAGSEAVGVDIMFGRVSKGYSVSGRIIDAETGKPVVGMMYGYGSMSRENGQLASMGYTSSTSNGRGEFKLAGIAPGKYAAFASPPNDSPMYSDLAAFTVTDGDVTGLVIKVHAGSSITGMVIVEGAEGLPGALRVNDVRFGVYSGSMNAARRFGQVVIAPDGSFRAVGLPPGIANFSMYYPAPKGLQLARVERDGVEQKNGIEVGLAEEISGVNVVFAYGSGTVRGQVKVDGGEIPAGAMMFLNVQRSGSNQPQHISPQPRPDSRGRFVIEGLLPGDYDILLSFLARPVAPGADGRQMISKSVKQRVSVTNGTETQITMIVDLNSKDR